MKPYDKIEKFIDNKNNFQYFYYKIENDLGNIIMSLSNLNFITITNEKETDKLKLKINITKKGKKIISELNNSSFLELQNRTNLIKKEMPYKITLFRELKGENNVFSN